MIQELPVEDPKRTVVKWWPDVFPRKRTFRFRPGVNVLWGPNGSGKTTVILALARMMHCEQSGFSTVTQTSIRAVYPTLRSEADEILNGIRLLHDGEPVRYFDPTRSVGLVGGMAGFDEDFFAEGLLNATMHLSSGQTAAERFAANFRRGGDMIEYRDNLIRGQQQDMVRASLEPGIEEGPRTVLLDEPDANLDWPARAMLWNWIRDASAQGKVQFIVATHSPVALRLPDTNWIELKRGYRKLCIATLDAMGLWSDT